MAYVRLSPGVWRDTATGKTVNSATDPNKAAATKTTSAGSTKTSANQVLPNNTQINNVAQGINTNANVAEQERTNNIIANNPNYQGPDSSSTVTKNPDGTYTQNVQRSGAQQQIANNQDALTQMGQQFAQQQLGQVGSQQFNPTLTARTTTGDLLADRGKVEDAVYKSLTKDTDRQESLANENVDQTLQNRGIPYSADPTSQYQQMKTDLNNRYDAIRSDARNQSVITGGNEYRSDAGLNETQRANDYGLQSGVHQQQLSDINTLSNTGGGLRDVNSPGFQGATATYGSPTDVNAALKQLALQKQALNKSSSGGGSSNTNSGSTTSSAFGG